MIWSAGTILTPALLQAGVNGEAVLRCERTEHGGMVGCSIVSEHPRDRGFGAAALKVAADAAECPTLALSAAERRPHEFMFGFRATPTLPVIWPEISTVARSAGYLIRSPSRAEIAQFYPPKAKQARVSGRAVMLCTATPQGDMAACLLEDENPKGYGFGDADDAHRIPVQVRRRSQGSQCPYAPTEVVIPVEWPDQPALLHPVQDQCANS